MIDLTLGPEGNSVSEHREIVGEVVGNYIPFEKPYNCNLTTKGIECNEHSNKPGRFFYC